MRKIKPHKGGRTKQLRLRLTPAEKEMLAEKASIFKINLTELVLRAVRTFKGESP